MHRPTHHSLAVKKPCDVATEAASVNRTTTNSKLRWLDDIRAQPLSKGPVPPAQLIGFSWSPCSLTRSRELKLFWPLFGYLGGSIMSSNIMESSDMSTLMVSINGQRKICATGEPQTSTHISTHRLKNTESEVAFDYVELHGS